MRWGAIKTGELLNSKKKEWELLKLLKCIIIIGAINKIRNHPRKTKYMFTIFICSNCNNFFSELCKHHTQSLLVPFLEPHFLFPLPGVDFSLHLFWGGAVFKYDGLYPNRSFLEQSFSVGSFHGALSNSRLGVRKGRGWRGKWHFSLVSFQDII